MSTFLSFKTKYDKGEVKRAYLVFGPERVLVEETIDLLRERIGAALSSRITFHADEVDSRDIWAEVNQYPLDEGKRLIVVRSAERLSNWDPLHPWITSRLIPHTHVIFVGPHEMRTKAKDSKHLSLPTHLKPFQSASAATTVECWFRKDEKEAEDKISYVMSKGTITKGAAKMLLETVAWDLSAAANFMRQVSYLPRLVDENLVRAFATPAYVDNFVEDLLHLRKPNALRAAEHIIDWGQRERLIEQLDRRLEVLTRLNRVSKHSREMADLVQASKLDYIEVTRNLPAAKYYDRQRFRSRVTTLAAVDSWHRTYVQDGLLEALVALW